MASERARRFLSRQEAEVSRPKLNPEAAILLDRFADLIGDYTFPKSDWVRCQLVDQKGKCKKLHGWGWIAQTADETEGYIGHDCVQGHFGNNPRFAALFAAAAARVGREIDKDTLVSRLNRLLLDENLPSSIESAKYGQRHLNAQILRIRTLLPLSLVKKLDRVKGNDRDVAIWVFYQEEEEDPVTKKIRKVTRRQQYSWGTITGIDGLDPSPTLRIGGRLSDASASLSQAVASNDQSDKDMKKWAAKLEYAARADVDITRQEALIKRFCQPEVLKLLWLLAHNRVDQHAIATAALEIATGKQPTELETSAAISQWTQEIMQAYGGRAFEVVG